MGSLIVGIDLGTTNSLIAYCVNGKPQVIASPTGSTMIPSIVHWSDGAKKPQVGTEAKHFRVTDPSHTAYSVKRFIGKGKSDLDPGELSTINTRSSTDQNITIQLGAKSFSPAELSSEILKKLKSQAELALGIEVKKAVITVPAYFNDSQRTATKLAGALAGLDVVRIVNEPTAAALAYGIDVKKNGTIAVYDLGGGTFDISILKIQDGLFEVLSTNGHTALGGDDFDRSLYSILQNKMGVHFDDLDFRAYLLDQSEKMKVALSEKEIVNANLNWEEISYGTSISRYEFEESICSLIDQTIQISKQALEDAKISIHSIDGILMVGGSTRIPFVRQKVKEFFGKTPNTSVNPDEVVALGAAVQADILSGSNKEMVLLDVVPLSLGIETYGGTLSKLIFRNSKIPAVAKETFTTHVEGQKNVLIHVLQGERELVADCRSLAQFDLRGLPPMPAGLPKIEVTFLVDANGILTVFAKELATGVMTQVEVKPSYGLSDEQVEKMLSDSIDNAESDMKNRQLIDTRVEAEGVLRAANKILSDAVNSFTKSQLEPINNSIAQVRNLLKGSDYVAIKNELEKLEEIAKPVAGLVMDLALKKNLKNKSVDQVLKK